MWTFEQSTGILFDAHGKPIEVGYAGHDEGLNNPLMQHVHALGPLPAGYYSMQPPYDHRHVGKYAIYLAPFESNMMFGRSEFFWHGDKIGHIGERIASDGCPIHSRPTRQMAWDSPDHVFHVVDHFKSQYPLPLGDS